MKMKQPLCMQPWDSSPEIVKKLFKSQVLVAAGFGSKQGAMRRDALSKISELNLSSGIEELESLIGSTLSSDII
ncbi:hypothetical protein L3X38_008574 [Prunus dulcis]|uniref:Uncharacterized protein n=1 Tax=Prunus dulcis TaxID=3755 RepID=A0AAD4ZWT5_PRUDU|nr:hypothetical protein L3X38_008574 [Prunus dulcis]